MNKEAYLKRIGFTGIPLPIEKTIHRLHRLHVFQVPFENLDIHFNKKISLLRNKIFKKIVEENRGGFCYELNYLFHLLLRELGFSTQIISARIFDSTGKRGPAFDHMAILVRHRLTWLLDVGFGDLFVQPLALIEDKIQYDGRNYFMIKKYDRKNYIVLMSFDKITFEKKYTFSIVPQKISSFKSICLAKQFSKKSYFVKNIICTKPTRLGRITLFNDKLIVKSDGYKKEIAVANKSEQLALLLNRFAIKISTSSL